MREFFFSLADRLKARLERMGLVQQMRLLSACISLLLACIASDFALGLRHLFWSQLMLSYLLIPLLRQCCLHFYGVDISPHPGWLSRIASRIIKFRQRRYQ